MINRFKVWLQWREIAKAQKSFHQERKELTEAVIEKIGIPAEQLQYLTEKYDPHKHIMETGGACHCGMMGVAFKYYGLFPCIFADYWRDEIAREEAQRKVYQEYRQNKKAPVIKFV